MARLFIAEPHWALTAAFLPFVTLDPWAIYEPQIPRHIDTFILCPLFLVALLREDGWGAKKTARLALLFAAVLLVHKLPALQFALLLSLFYALLVIRSRNLQLAWLRTLTICLVMAAALSLAFFFPYLKLMATSHSLHPYYGDESIWTVRRFGLPFLSPHRIYVVGGHFVELALVTLPLLFFGLFRKGRPPDLFLAASILLPTLIYLTPAGYLLGKILTPGVVVESFISGSVIPYAILFVLWIRALWKYISERLPWSWPTRPTASLISIGFVCFLFGRVTFQQYWRTLHSFPPTAREYLGEEAIQFFSHETGRVVVADPFSSAILPQFSPVKVVAADRLAVVGIPTERLRDVDTIFARSTPTSAILRLMDKYQASEIFLNRAFWKAPRDPISEAERFDFHFPLDEEPLVVKLMAAGRFRKVEVGTGSVVLIRID